MAASALDGLYLNTHWPLTLANLLQGLIGNQQSAPNVPQVASQPVVREWYSQPRPDSDPTVEVLTVNFKLPLSIGEFSIEIQRVSCTFFVWYQDRSNNWIQMRDENYQPMQITLSPSQEISWYRYHAYTYPIVAKAIQFRVARKPDLALGNQPYSIALRNGLIRRNIYVRSAGTQAMEDEQDALGNVISKYIRDWPASDAIDDEPYTFWRSQPQPDPQAVVSLYLDVRTPEGDPQRIDTLYLDPVYINQNLNVYYSSDDTVGTRVLSPISLVPDVDENTRRRPGEGLSDISADNGISLYRIPLAIGPQLSQPVWIGLEWAPDFDVQAGPSQNPVLFGVNPGRDALQSISIVGTATGGSFELSPDGVTFTDVLSDTATGDDVQAALEVLDIVGSGNVLAAGEAGGPWTVSFLNELGQQAVPNLQVVNSLTGAPLPRIEVRTITAGYAPPYAGGTQYWPTVYFDVGGVELTLELTNGVDTQVYSVPLVSLPDQGVPMRVVVGWTYDPDPQVFLAVTRPNGQILAEATFEAPELPAHITLDGEVGYQNFRGTMTSLVIKLEEWTKGYRAFQANSATYVNPDPVQPDPHTGRVPSTTLDDAVLAVDWTLQQTPVGGGHASAYANKTWIPVFADYITQKGRFYFPRPVMAKYLQLEFTNLTQESYPVYDAGISVMYQVFPLSVTQTQTTPTLGSILNGLINIGGQLLGGGNGSVNWLNPSTITNAINAVFGQTVSPIAVQVGPSYTTTTAPTLPNTVDSSAANTSTEISSPWIYRRQLPDVQVLASQALNTMSAGAYNFGSQVLNPWLNAVGTTVNQAFSSLVNFSPTSTSLPLQGVDFWLVPGQTLAIAASVMRGLTQFGQTLLNPTPATTTRLRFTDTSVHQYAIKTAVRDAAIAYFAGIREVQAFSTIYIASQDPPRFTFDPYDPKQVVYHNINQLVTGPLTTAGISYRIQNPLFDTDLTEWTQVHGTWTLDPAAGRYQYGAAKVTANGAEQELLSALVTSWPAVTPGANFSVSVWVQWSNVTINDTTEPVQLQLNFYDATGAFLSQQVASLAPSGTSLWTTGNGTQLTGDFTVPNGAAEIKIGLVLTPDITAGDVWWDTVLIGSTDVVEGTTFIDLITSSTFNKVNCEFHDSGVVRGDNMWADADPLNTNISATKLAWYTDTIPDKVPAGTWASDTTMWADDTVVWGAPHAVVQINVDPNMVYDGKRVLHITRAAGYGEAGVAIRQVTNFVPSGLFRLCLRYNKPVADGNQIIVRLRRVSDGVYIYEHTFDPDSHPGATGFWYELQTDFQELPDTNDQIYTLEAVVSGDAAGDFYINDAWVEIAQIRYFVRLGGEGAFLHDVTALRYTDTAIVSVTRPVNEFTVQTAILSPNAWAYGATITPNYLK